MNYTCREYREEMTLVGLRLRLKDETLSPEEKEDLKRKIAQIEDEMGIK
mgnify:CR=1 FL=1